MSIKIIMTKRKYKWFFFTNLPCGHEMIKKHYYLLDCSVSVLLPIDVKCKFNSLDILLILYQLKPCSLWCIK